MQCQALLLFLALAAFPGASGLRPPVRQNRTLPEAGTSAPVAQPEPTVPPPPVGLLQEASQAFARMAGAHFHAAGTYALPQMVTGAELHMWLWRTGIQRETLWWIIIIETLILMATTGLPVLIWLGTRILGNTIEAGIETFDRSLIGVDVEIDRITPNLIYGILDIEHLEVKNPEGKGYDSPYLLKANRITIDIDMARLFMSGFKHVKIEKMIFQNVDVIFEKTWNSSNVGDILEFLSKGSKKEEEAKEEKKDEKKAIKDESCPASTAEKTAAPASSAPPARTGEVVGGYERKRKAPEPKKVEKKAEPAPAVDVTLHEVLIEDVGARAQANMLGGRGFRLSIADIRYIDFQKEMGASMVDEIVVILLKTVLKTVLSNIIGKRLGDQCM